MTRPDPGLTVVGPITVPITATLFRTLEETWDPMALTGGEPVVVTMTLSGHPVRGSWKVVGLRADFALAGNRTFWATFAWMSD